MMTGYPYGGVSYSILGPNLPFLLLAMLALILLAILRAIPKLLARETNPPLAVGKAMRKHALVE